MFHDRREKPSLMELSLSLLFVFLGKKDGSGCRAGNIAGVAEVADVAAVAMVAAFEASRSCRTSNAVAVGSVAESRNRRSGSLRCMVHVSYPC